MTCTFLCRPSKTLKDGLNPLELSIIIKKQRKVITLDRHFDAHTFNSKKQRFRKNEEGNLYIESILSKVHAIETEMIRRNIPFNLNTFVDVFNHGFQDVNITLLELFDRHNSEALTKVQQKIIVIATYQKYLRTRQYVYNFLLKYIHKNDILLTEVTPNFIEQLYVYLLSFMSQNTAIHKMKLIKKIFRMAQEEGYIKSMPFKLKMTSKPLEYEPLTIDEIRLLRIHKFSCERLAQVRDIFVFACYSGLSFTDLRNLSQKDLCIDENGNKWIIKPRQKTKIISHIPLLPIAEDIWRQYAYHLPILSNPKYNEYLKEIADCCGINKRLYSHLARHTFATILLNNGVDIVSVSKILGHSNSRITEKTYAQMMPSTILKRVKAIESVLM